MRKLELSEEQVEKLFEMLKDLFPNDYPYPRINEYLVVYNKGFHGTNEFIHWFELTWLLLMETLRQYNQEPMKVWSAAYSYGLTCLRQYNPEHPIDWVYRVFKELKNKSAL